jgi:G:T-mismatch repair DNA endonuclease (very short patch repair protein)
MKKNGKAHVVGEFHHSEKSKNLIGEKAKGRMAWNKSLKGQIAWNKGIKCPKISQSKIGHIVTKEQREKNRKGTLTYMSENPEKFLAQARKGALIQNMKCGFYDTKPELEVKALLDSAGIKYIHPYAVWNIEHCYPADFYLPDSRTILEVDGVYWHSYPNGRDLDRIRTGELTEKGYNVVRVWETETKNVLERLA